MPSERVVLRSSLLPDCCRVSSFLLLFPSPQYLYFVTGPHVTDSFNCELTLLGPGARENSSFFMSFISIILLQQWNFEQHDKFRKFGSITPF